MDDEWSRSAGRLVRRLQDEVNRLFEDSWPTGGGFPAVNVWSNSNEAVVTAEIPGIDPKSLDVSVMGNVLTIGGERRQPEISEKDHYLRRERGFGQFTRTVELPFMVNGEKIEATCSNGILKVVMQRAESDRPKKITVAS